MRAFFVCINCLKLEFIVTVNHDHPISPSPTMGYAHGESVRRRTDELKLELSALWQDQVRAFDRVDSSTNYRNHIDPSISSLRNEEVGSNLQHFFSIRLSLLLSLVLLSRSTTFYRLSFPTLCFYPSLCRNEETT